MTSYQLTCAVAELAKLRDALAAIETATARKHTDGRADEVGNWRDYACWIDATYSREATLVGVPINEIRLAVLRQIDKMVECWPT